MEQTPSCKYYRLLADEYIEGELTTEEMLDFEAHIAVCPECRKELEELRALKEMLADSDEDIPEGLHERIMSAVKSEAKPQRSYRRAVRRTAVSAACAVICLSLALIFTILPLWQENTGSGLPEDYPSAGTDEAIKHETDASVNAEVSFASPADSQPPAESFAEVPDQSPIETDVLEPECSLAEPETSSPESTSAAEDVTMIVSESLAPAPDTSPEIVRPETEASASTEAPTEESNDAIETLVETLPIAANTNAPGAVDGEFDTLTEASKAPGGDEITFALLIVSGLLAFASFIAFLISLSSVRNTPAKKNNREEE